MNDEFLPCPFCGSDTIELFKYGNEMTATRKIVIKCNNCRISLTNKALRHTMEWLEEISIKAWNTRQPEKTIKEQLDDLTDEQRYHLISEYCYHCGSKDYSCNHWKEAKLTEADIDDKLIDYYKTECGNHSEPKNENQR